jgi:hypothetical protein
MYVSKNTNNYSYIHGDFDKDHVPNIDDEYPFDPNRKQRVNKEVSLDKLFSYLDNKRAKAETQGKKLKKKTGATTYRVKDNYSTINKLVRRNKFVSNDFIGLRFETDKRPEARSKWKEFNLAYKIKSVPTKATLHSFNSRGVLGGEVIGSENKYRANTGTKNLYRAYHTNFTLPSGKSIFGVEAQFRTRKYGALNDAMHKAYKQGKKTSPEHKRQSKRLLRKGY